MPGDGRADETKDVSQSTVSIRSLWNPLIWNWVPSEEDILKYRRSWNPLSNGPILLSSVDINPKGQFHMQYFGFGEIGHQQFDNKLTTHGSDSPVHLIAFEPLIILGYGITDHVEFDAAFTGLYWQASQSGETSGRQSTSNVGVGDTSLYLKYRPMVQDPDRRLPSITIYNQVTLPTSTYFGAEPIPGGFSPLGKLPATRSGALALTEGVLFRKNLKPFRISGGLFYSYAVPGSNAGMSTYGGDIVNTRLIFEHILDESNGFGYNLEFVTVHGLPVRIDGHDVTDKPSSFQLFGVEPAIQYRFGEHWVGAVGVLFTLAGQNNIDAVYPNFSLYYYWDSKGGATMR